MDESAEIMTIGSTVAIYTDLEPDVQGEVRAAADRIRARMRRSVEDIIEIGRELTAVKKNLGHRKFQPWIETEFGMTQRTAQRFMSVHEKFGKSDTVSHLKITPAALYLLAAPSTDDKVVNAAMKKGKAGEKIDKKTIDDLKANVKTANAKQQHNSSKTNHAKGETVANIDYKERCANMRPDYWSYLRKLRRVVSRGVV